MPLKTGSKVARTLSFTCGQISGADGVRDGCGIGVAVESAADAVSVETGAVNVLAAIGLTPFDFTAGTRVLAGAVPQAVKSMKRKKIKIAVCFISQPPAIDIVKILNAPIMT